VTRLRRIEDRDRIFFVTTNLSRDQRHLSPEECESILEALDAAHAKGTFLLFGYVVMPNHVHLLLSPRNCGLIPGITLFKSAAAKLVLKSRTSRGPFWQTRYFDNIIRRVRDFWEKLDYIHENPVKAGLVASAEDWPYSSSNAYVRKRTAPIDVDPIDLRAEGNTLLWPAPWRR
jgi:putative transposase